MENAREFADLRSPESEVTGIRAPVSVLEQGESPSVEACLAEALEALSLRRGLRDAKGQWADGNTAKATTFTRSTAHQEAVAVAKDAIVRQVTSDLAAEGNAPATLQRLIVAYAEATLTRESLFLQMVNDGGPITSKRRTSAVYAAYLAALDREMRLAQLLGLERKTRAVVTAAEILS